MPENIDLRQVMADNAHKKTPDYLRSAKVRRRDMEEIFKSKLLPDEAYCKSCGYPKRPCPGGPCEFCWERSKADAATLARWKEMIGGEKAWSDYTPDRYVRTQYNAEAFAAAQVGTWNKRRDDGKGGGFLLSGPRGTGKSHLASIIKRPLIMGGTIVRTVFMQEELDAARHDIKKKDQSRDRVSSLVNAPVLSIEDLGVEKPSEWVVNEWYYKIVDGRYKARRTGLIVTMNQSLEDLEFYWRHFDPHGRVVSRLREMCKGNIFSLNGEKDWRAE